MSKLDASPEWIKSNLPNFWDNPLILGDRQNIGLLHGDSGYGDAGVKFMLMKGEVPINFASISNISSRINDLLVMYETLSNAKEDFDPSILDSNPTKIATDYKPAIASGQCTWFWWVVGEFASTSIEPITKFGLNKPFYQNVYGTVGNVGSGADLILDTGTNIIKDENYRISNFQIRIPTQFGYI